MKMYFNIKRISLIAILIMAWGIAMGGMARSYAVPSSIVSGDDAEQANDSLPPVITTDLPVFPLEVLYVVTKEYESVEDGTSQKNVYRGKPIGSYSKFEYVEQRLMELYPKQAYRGLADDSRHFYDSVNHVYGAYAMANKQQSEKIDGQVMLAQESGQDEIMDFVSDEKEIEMLQITEEEEDMLDAYNHLARKPDNASLDDILGIAQREILTNTNLNVLPFGFFCVVSVGKCSHLYYRIMLCKERAETAAEENYSLCTSGEKGDAFRHIAVSMMLRRYLTETLSYMIMDIGHERVVNPNSHVCDTYMDLHNNRVGRNTKYWRFRGNYSADKHDWRAWLRRIKEFVDEEANAAHMDWNKDMDEATVSKQRKKTSRNKYIYYGEGEN